MSGHRHQHDYPPTHQQQQEEGENGVVFTFPSNNGYDRTMGLSQQEEQQIQRAENSTTRLNTYHEPAVYETAGMLSEMFNFGHTGGPAPEILGQWYGQGQGQGAGRQQLARDSNSNSDDQMQLFLTNPPPRSPSSPPAAAGGSTLHMLMPSPPNQLQPPSGFHPMAAMGGIYHQHHHPSAATTANSNPTDFWGGELGGIVEGQGLSLSLSSSLQQLEAAKQQAEEFYHGRIVAASSSNTNNNNPTSSPRHFFKHLAGPNHQQPILQNLQGIGAPFGPGMIPAPVSIQQQVHMGFGSPSSSSSTTTLGGVNVLRSSKYAKAAQDLLEEFCSVGRGQLTKKKPKLTRQDSSNPNPSSSNEGGRESTSSKDHQPPPPLSPADRIEHQRRKVKLLSMLDEVDRRYNHYCEQMQMVVNSFDMVMGYGASVPYTALAQKAMSRHFRCLKEGIQAQLKQSCEALGEKDPTTGSAGLTKGETPRLKMLEQSLRQQRAFHQMGLMEQHDAWRPQRGLPERSVNLLRAWLFEHFLHPYPSDADKHLLARQTGLSRNQVANWFINARVRLWKPMIEEMYQQEESNLAEEEDDVDEDEKQEEQQHDRDINHTRRPTTNISNTQNNTNNTLIIPTTKTQTPQQEEEKQEAQNPIPSSSAHINNNNNNASTVSTSGSTVITVAKRSAETMTRWPPPHHDIHTHHHPSSLLPINTHHHHHPTPNASAFPPPAYFQAVGGDDSDCQQFSENVGPTTMIRFGTTPGDVSLTLGLRHAGNNNNNNNVPDKTPAFSLRDFGSGSS